MSQGLLAFSPDTLNSIVFEHPLSERVRLFLRLEFLFDQHRHHRADASPCGTRAALGTLVDIISLAGRGDLKTEVIKDLSEQHGALTRLRQRSDVDPTRLDAVLAEIHQALNAMQGLTTHATATGLRENEFLMTFANRNTVPGGTSPFDLPHFHTWLGQPAEYRKRDLDGWFADLAPLQSAITLYLRLLRNTTEWSSEKAHGGVFMQTPLKPLLLLRIALPAQARLYPEVSGAGKHRYTIRFMTLRDLNSRSTQVTQDLDFRLQGCLF